MEKYSDDDYYGLRRLHEIYGEDRFELVDRGNAIIAEHAKRQRSHGKLRDRIPGWNKAASYSNENKRTLGYGLGAMVIMATVATVSWRADTTNTENNHRTIKYALHEVLTNPVDLLTLGICPDALRYQADRLPPSEASSYRRAADQEEQLNIPCTPHSVASLTINLPDATQTRITPVDIIPANY